jgi:hypothetical protein
VSDLRIFSGFAFFETTFASGLVEDLTDGALFFFFFSLLSRTGSTLESQSSLASSFFSSIVETINYSLP